MNKWGGHKESRWGNDDNDEYFVHPLDWIIVEREYIIVDHHLEKVVSYMMI